MKKIHIECDSTLIERFFDNELAPDEHERFSRHLEDCPSCQKAVRDNQTISALFKSSLSKALSQTSFEDLEENVLNQIRKRSVPWWKKLIDFLSSKKFLVPATAMAAILLFLTLTRQPVPVPDQSAIVKSFSGDVSSVMIIETPKTRQTIIWYNESS